MTQPLALVLYEKLLPGTQLVNRLQDLGYRVVTVKTKETLTECAEREKPMLVVVDLMSRRMNVSDAILKLRENPATSHLPVIAFGDEKSVAAQSSAALSTAGTTLVVSESAVLTHFEPFLERALQLD